VSAIPSQPAPVHRLANAWPLVLVAAAILLGSRELAAQRAGQLPAAVSARAAAATGVPGSTSGVQ
jgi:hypothetical protein